MPYITHCDIVEELQFAGCLSSSSASAAVAWGRDPGRARAILTFYLGAGVRRTVHAA